jgi:hypothetical protein
MSERSVEGFWERVEKVALTGCWVWRGNILRNRYGTWSFTRNGKTSTVLVHRFAYRLLVGSIPEGLVLDHLCLNRTCCNPEHMEPISQAENVARGRKRGADDGGDYNRKKTHCPHGHPYAGENLYRRPDGARGCRTCARIKVAEYRAKKRAESPPTPRPRKEACVNGHAFTPENTLIDGRGRRCCRECKRAQVKKYRAREDKQVVHRIEVCKNGHAMDEANSAYAADGTRSCRACNREKARASYQRHRGDRGVAFAERTHCPQGHPYDEVNTYVTSKGHRQCRTCNKAREVARTEKRRAERASV